MLDKWRKVGSLKENPDVDVWATEAEINQEENGDYTVSFAIEIRHRDES